MQVIFAREKISGELESSAYRSRSFYFRDRSLNCDYAHVSTYSLACVHVRLRIVKSA
jgi:hypothetical protein